MINSITINNCNDCPFKLREASGMYCSHPKWKDSPGAYDNMIITQDHLVKKRLPEECPLIHDSLTITYKLSKPDLFLDDIRSPKMAYIYTRDNIYLKETWNIVRNYDEFVSHIETNGLPKFISFDHDLADEHYTPEEYWDSYEKSKEYQESVYPSYKEKTGLECAKWLVNYCMDNNLKLPGFISHSQNPVGKNNIEAYLSNFKSHQIKFQ